MTAKPKTKATAAKPRKKAAINVQPAKKGEVSLLTRPLGLEGWESLEPIVLAALTTEDPLLLIGKHGSAKSFLLERLAQALKLDYRFYNASLVNYDDLVGIPIPDEKQRSLHYIATPSSIWDAEVVFIDEINRTRPDLQNKLFPIIHERRVQGTPLKNLRYRWAAMNPPANPEIDAEDEDIYLGVEPLDPALADRFAFLITTPSWQDLTETQKHAVLSDQFAGEHEFPIDPVRLVTESRRHYDLLRQKPPSALRSYLICIERLLGQSKLNLSARRISILHRNILAIQSARITLAKLGCAKKREVDWSDSALLAIRYGLPQVAQSGTIDQAPLVAAHRQAWEVLKLDKNDPWRELLQVGDPLERLVRGVQFGASVADGDLGQLILDAIASQPSEAFRTASGLAVYLAIHQDRNIPGTVIETLAQNIHRVLKPQSGERQVHSIASGVAREVGDICSDLPTKSKNTHDRQRALYTRNLLNALLPDGYDGARPKAVRDLFDDLWNRLSIPAVIDRQPSVS